MITRTISRFQKSFSYAPLRDLLYCVILIILTVVTRVPFLKYFDLVAFDGTFYINEAQYLLGNYKSLSSFPIGYPLFIAVLIPLIRDGVRAAQAVSFLFSIGSVLILFLLAKEYVKKNTAFFCAALLSINPLFVSYSLVTMSEATYMFWILLGLYLYARRQYLRSGLSLGLAFITRPEALTTFLALALLSARKSRRLLALALGFAVLYSSNVAIYYGTTHNVKVLSKAALIGKASSDWREGEFRVTGDTTASDQDYSAKKTGIGAFISYYFLRLSSEGNLLLRFLLPVILFCAILGAIKKPLFLLAALCQFFLYPFFNIRISPRYVLPYIPILLIYAFIFVYGIRPRKVRHALYGLFFVSAVLSLWLNQDQLRKPISYGYPELKTAGRELRVLIGKADKVADRKPFLAFYAGGEYLRIPANQYEDIMSFLMKEKADYLVIHEPTVKVLRRSLLPLLHSSSVINGELRFEQIYVQKGKNPVIVYKRKMESDPLKWRRLTFPETGIDISPSWSPDGQWIAFGSDRTGRGDIYITGASDGSTSMLIGGPSRENFPSWAPDGKKLAFVSNASGNLDIFVYDMATHKPVQITTHPGSDSSPSWSEDSGSIFFTSDRSGAMEIWRKDLATGKLIQISKGGNNTFPAASHLGGLIAWTKENEGVVVYNTVNDRTSLLKEPKDVHGYPSWSHDSRFIAVTANDWGSDDVYIINVETGGALLLTKNQGFDGSAAWSPIENKLALISDKGGTRSIWIVGGLEPYLERLENPVTYYFLKEGPTGKEHETKLQ
jgi:hypothetical protein